MNKPKSAKSVAASTAISLVQVPFHGDTLDAVNHDGKIMVSLKRVCESLGVDVDSQRLKLKSPDYDWCDIVDITVVAQDGKLRSLTMIDHESLPLWLVTINPVRVRQNVKEKLRLYKREAKSVLAAWFLGTSTDMPALAKEFADIKRRFEAVESDHMHAKGMLGIYKAKCRLNAETIDDQAGFIDAVMHPFDNHGGEFMAIRDFTNKYGVFNDLGMRLTAVEIRLAGRLVKAMSVAMNVPVCQVPGDLSSVNAYRIDVLHAWRINHDMRARTCIETFQKILNGKLYK